MGTHGLAPIRGPGFRSGTLARAGIIFGTRCSGVQRFSVINPSAQGSRKSWSILCSLQTEAEDCDRDRGGFVISSEDSRMDGGGRSLVIVVKQA